MIWFVVGEGIVSSTVVTAQELFTPAELAELRALDLPDTDGKPMDSDWQRIETSLLIEIARHHLRQRPTGYCGGNMCLYYSLTQARNLDFLGPDFFYVKDAEPHKVRKKWEIWEENNLFPDVIIEYLSPSTQANDVGKKKAIYERTFHTKEYYVYDPDDVTLRGWRLSPLTSLYEQIETDEEGRMYSEELELWIGAWHGTIQDHKTTWLRLFHDDGTLVLRPEEVERLQRKAEQREKEQARREKEMERREKEQERREKEMERRDKEAALQLAAEERAAKEAALAELEKLREQLKSS